MDRKVNIRTLPQLLNRALTTRYFEGDSPAIPHYRKDGTGKLAVVVGENASGKSFFRRILGSILAHHVTSPVEFIHVSMQGRTSGGVISALMYGSEEYESTGAISTHAVLTGITTCRSRTKPHIVFWDEPDLGLSDNWAAGVGKTIGDFTRDMPASTLGAFIVTHSRALVSQLLDLDPYYLHLGTKPEMAPQTLTAWYEQPIKPRDLAELRLASQRRFKKIQKHLNQVKKESP